MDNVLNRDLC